MHSRFWLGISLLSLMSFGCEKSVSADCVANPKEDCVCIEIYKPVCGCDDITYSNACFAACSGIAVVSEGMCSKDAATIPGDYEFLGYQIADDINLDQAAAKHSFPAYAKFTGQEDDFKIEGRSGVNYFFGSYEIKSPGNVSVSVQGSTKIAGSTEATTFEQKFWQSMSAVQSYESKNKLLLLGFGTDQAQDWMVFAKK